MANKEFVVRNGLIVANNTTIHVTANSVGVTANSFTGNGVNITSVDALTVGGNTVPDIRTYADTKASDAYSNSVSYVNGLRLDSISNTSTTSIAVANSVKTAYDSAIAANTRAASAQSAATAAYSNSVSYVNGLRLDSISNTSTTYIAVANSVKTAYDSAISAATAAYSNSVSYVNGLRLDSISNTSTTYIAVANSVKTAYDSAIAANTRAASAQSAATAAYSNAVTFAANATNLTTGTVPSARLSGSYTILSSNATLSTKASTLSRNGGDGLAMTFNWAGQSGTPTYVWGSNDGTGANNNVYYPANFSVNYAASAGNAETLDGIDSSQFLRSDTSDIFSGGLFQVYSQSGVDITNTGQINSLQIYQGTTGADAVMSFHVSGDYALHFGLDADTNDLSVGGWSMGATKYKVWHAGNDGSGSGLDADLLDGQQGSYYQPASSAITTSNIGSQTVSSSLYLRSGGTSGGSNMMFSGTVPGGSPSYLWGGNGTNNYLYSPSSLSVGNADTVDGYHAASFALLTGANFTGRVYGASSVTYGILGTSSATYGILGQSSVSNLGGVLGYAQNGAIYGILGHNNTYSFYGVGDAYVTGQVIATSNVTAYYSDKRLKTNITSISKPLELLSQINGVYFTENDLAKSFGYDNDEVQIGVLAQEVQKVVPNAVTLAPFDIEIVDGKATSKSGENYLTVKYEKLVPLLIEAVKELKNEVDELRSKLENK